MTHRFYTGETKDRSGLLELDHEVWINDRPLVNQILRVLRMRTGEEIILFNGTGTEILYRIKEIEANAVCLEMVTDITPSNPKRKIILAWSLLKKDKNEWVLQKCTELGVTHFLPMVTDRTEKLGIDLDRAHRIIIEAVEQSGRHVIPQINEPQSLSDIVGQHREHMQICVADMEGAAFEDSGVDEVLILIGPEGGWSDKERVFFASENIAHISISNFTLRAETACVSAVSMLANR